MHAAIPTFLLLLSAGAAAPALPGQATAAEPVPVAVPAADYAAHEWGTFTSMVGTDGGVLEGLHREEEALPDFVHDLLQVREFGVTRSKLPASRVTQKMETPVIYFHTEQPLRVRVDVRFRQGLMTQFYPLPHEIWPRLAAARRQRIDLSTVDGSRLSWDIDLIPRSSAAPDEIPAAPPDHAWGLARQVSAAWVRTRTEGTPAQREAEHYLFYRGLGRWQPALELQLLDGAVRLRNAMAGTIPFVAVLELGERGGRFLLGEAMAAGAAQRLPLGDVAFAADRGRTARRLGAAVLQALVGEGLHVDEARAMVATWSRSWFQQDGARVIYLLPRPVVDEVLPLRLEPRPRELVRALVGRLEFVSHEGQRRVERALRQIGGDDPVAARAGRETLAGLDRFLEPHLRNVVSNGLDAAARDRAARMLAELVP